jgi:tRNA(Ile)-lysidine synthase
MQQETIKTSPKLLPLVQRTIARYRMLDPGDRVIVAVSGGADSVCLLHLLLVLRDPYALALHVAHLHHGLRGSEADRDEAFVRREAERLGLSCTVERLTPTDYAPLKKLSRQAAARELRYAFLRRTAERVGATRIALGHTADDQVETILLRLLQGSGPEGWGGIPPVRGPYIRPLIETPRALIEEYLPAAGISWLEDSSNRDLRYLRNYLRREVLPLLRRLNPRLAETVGRSARLLREDSSHLEAEAAAAFDRAMVDLRRPGEGSPPAPVPISSGAGDRLVLSIAAVSSLDPSLQRRILRRVIATCRGSARGLRAEHLEAARERVLAGSTGSRIVLPGGWTLRNAYGRLIMERHPSVRSAPPAPVPVSVPGRTAAPAFGLLLETAWLDRLPAESMTRDCLYLDAERLPGPLQLRARLPGDSLHPAGMRGQRKKLQDLLVDMRIPREDRDRIPLLVGGDALVWVVGLRADGRFLAGPATRRPLMVRALPLAP